jgi:hypothetical protein
MGEPGKYSLDIHGTTTLKDPGAGVVSPGEALLGMPALVPRTTKSYNKLPALSVSRGLASTTSMPAAPYGAMPAPSTSIVDATTGRWRATGSNEA